MTVNSIGKNGADFQLPSIKIERPAVTTERLVPQKNGSFPVAKLSNVRHQPDKDALVKEAAPTKSGDGVISHVVVSYNQHGQIRTKFEDSRNNVVYQMPSEMVTKLEDQMAKPENSTNISG